MVRQISEENLEAIVDAVRQHQIATAQQIARALGGEIPLRTLQHRRKQAGIQQIITDEQQTLCPSRYLTNSSLPGSTRVVA